MLIVEMVPVRYHLLFIYLFVLLLSFDPHLQLVLFGAMVSKIFLRLGFRFLEKFPTEQHPQKHHKRFFFLKK